MGSRAHKVNTMSLVVRAVIGAVAAMVIALVAYRARSLSGSGAIAAAVVGTVAAAAGWSWAALLIVYFISSTLLSRLGRQRKVEHTTGMIEKPGARDGWQVLSNGLVFSIAAVLATVTNSTEGLLGAAAAGALAASAADTWATEVGTLVGHTPRSILTGRKLAVGQSGGVTLAGSLASLAGAAFVALAAVGLGWAGGTFLGILVGGILGSVADSVVGAVFQRRLWCDACGELTEMSIHDCGTASRPAGGLSFVGNDLVNLLATLVGALVASMPLMPGNS